MICAQPITHTIKAGDSLWLIAQAHNTTAEEIMTMNPGLDPYNLQIGTQIYVCENDAWPDQGGMNHLGDEMDSSMTDQMNCVQTVAHTVKAGDSLWLIAQAHGTTVEAVMSMNPGIDPYNLSVGTQIYVCDNLMNPATGAGTNHLGAETEYTMPDEAGSGSVGQIMNGGMTPGGQGQTGQMTTGGTASEGGSQPGQMTTGEMAPGGQGQTGQMTTGGTATEGWGQTGQMTTGGTATEGWGQTGQMTTGEMAPGGQGQTGQMMTGGTAPEGWGQPGQMMTGGTAPEGWGQPGQMTTGGTASEGWGQPGQMTTGGTAPEGWGQPGQMMTGGAMAGCWGQPGQMMTGGTMSEGWSQPGQTTDGGTMAGSQGTNGQMMTGGTMSEGWGQNDQMMTGGSAAGEIEQPVTGGFGQGMMEGTMGAGQGQSSALEELPPTQIAPLPSREEFPGENGEVWTQPVPERYVPENMLPGYPEWAAGMMGSSGMTGEPGAMGGTGMMGGIGTVSTGMMGNTGAMGTAGNMGTTATQSLNNRMRQVWSQHLYWIRMLMVSILGRMDDQRQVTSRALQTPADIMAVFAIFYPASDIRQVGRLLTNHVQDGAALVTALRDGNKKRAEELNRNLYANSGQLANALGDLNPYYNRKQLNQMLSGNIDRSNRQTVNRLAGNYTQDVKELDSAKKEMMDLADYLTEGIFQQFYS